MFLTKKAANTLYPGMVIQKLIFDSRVNLTYKLYNTCSVHNFQRIISDVPALS